MHKQYIKSHKNTKQQNVGKPTKINLCVINRHSVRIKTYFL